MSPCDLDLLRSWRLWLIRVVVIHPCTKFEVRRPCHLEDMVDDVSPLMGLVTMTFDLETTVFQKNEAP